MQIRKNKIKFHIIIQARFNSNRLKGKILKKINNNEILLIMIKRLKKFKDNIIINISEKNSNELIKFCKKNKINFFVGSDKNVLKRYYDCANFYNSKIIIRIPSDCPLIDPKIIEKGLKIFFSGKYSYVSNLCPATYMDGNDVEIFNLKTLKIIYKKAKSNFDKEHVTTFLRKNLKKFNFKNFEDNKDLSRSYRYTLDYKEDFELIKQTVSKLGFFVTYKNIYQYLKNNKKISNLNKKYIGTMWYQKNL